ASGAPQQALGAANCCVLPSFLVSEPGAGGACAQRGHNCCVLPSFLFSAPGAGGACA
ncbi:hypothetical protein A2U01_0006690, partial [Trifolium medium]|nr:hypothetical protein [Trifolium medium]